MRKINLDEYDIDIQDENFGIDEDNIVEVNTNKSTVANLFYEWIHSIIVAIVIVVLLLTFVFRLVNIKGTSMVDTLHNQDKVIITNFMYEPKVGDIVVFPADEKVNTPIIKRVIALEGQQVYIDYTAQEVYVDGILLKEDYVYSPMAAVEKDLSVTVGEGQVFVLGDNRLKSLDSRSFGCKNVDDIIGKAQFIIYPFDRFGYIY